MANERTREEDGEPPNAAGEAPEQARADEAPAPAQHSRKRRLASLLLLAGAGIAAATVMPHVPSERRVELRVDDPASLIGLDVTWTVQGEAEPTQGSSWHFAPGAAPRSLVASVRLPDGRYDLDIVVERTEGRTSLRRAVTLTDSEQVTVPIR